MKPTVSLRSVTVTVTVTVTVAMMVKQGLNDYSGGHSGSVLPRDAIIMQQIGRLNTVRIRRKKHHTTKGVDIDAHSPRRRYWQRQTQTRNECRLVTVVVSPSKVC